MSAFFSVLYEDNHILAVEKPSGWTTKKESDGGPSVESAAKEYIQQSKQKPGNVFLHAIHRIDRPVSGVVVLAKTSKALSRLSASIHQRNCKKIYWALVDGIGMPLFQELTHDLLSLEYIATVASGHPQAKSCLLRYCVIKEDPPSRHSLLRIELITGRYHQIRLQLSSIGHPIWGDLKYGSHHLFYQQAIALHHAQMCLIHPTLNTPLSLQSALPEYWPDWARQAKEEKALEEHQD